MSRIGVAIIGAGFMGKVHVEALRRTARVDVVGMLGSSPTKSQQSAQQLEIPRAYQSLDHLLDDDAVQSVHINTPNRHHFSMAARALEAGKHVLCEKPLAMTAEQSGELVHIASQRPEQAAGVNYNIRHYPLCIEARQRVASGDFGELFHVTGSYTQDWLLFSTDYNWRVLSSEGGELRAVADIGTHWLDLVQWISGRKVTAVCADLHTVHSSRHRPQGEVQTFQGSESSVETEPVEITTDDFGVVMLRFDGGTRGCLHVSQVNAGHKNCLRLEMAGAAQSLAWNSQQPNQLEIGHRNQPNQTLTRDPALLSAAARRGTDYPGGHNEGYADSFKQCFTSFYEHIATGDFSQPPPFPTFAEGHQELLLCEAILTSHRRQEWVEL